MWKDVNLLPGDSGKELTQEELLQFQVALNRRLSHVLSHIKSNQIINLEANKITTDQAFITTAQIEALTVGGNVIMGPDAFISWNNVTEPPFIPDEYTDAEALAAIEGTYIDGENVWTINVYAQNLNTSVAKITTAQIEDLIVGGNVIMGPNAFISWENVTEKPIIPGEYTDAEAIAAIQGTYIDGENVWTINVYAQNITAGFLKLVEGMKIGTEDESVSIDKDGIKITGGKISIKSENAETLIDEFGINPKFLDYSKNLIWNSSFEVFDADLKPLFWIGQNIQSSQASTFYSDRSLKLPSGVKTWQSWAARTKPWWIGNEVVRVSMYANFVQQFTVSVVDIGTWMDTTVITRYYLLTDNDGGTGDAITGDNGEGSALTFTGSDGWEDSRISFTFDSNQYPSDSGANNITAFAIMIENIDNGDLYIDGIMAHVDFTGQWAQLYKDGPRSTAVQSVGNYFTNPDFVPGSPEEAIFLDGVPLTELKLYDDGMILTLLDGTVTEYDFALDGEGNITSLTNGTTGIVTVIDDIGGAKP